VTTPPLAELIDRYQQLSTPVVYDILDQLGHPGQAMAIGICPLAPDMIVAGPAFTIAGETDDPTRSTEQSPYQIFRDIVPDSVIVMATAGHRLTAGRPVRALLIFPPATTRLTKATAGWLLGVLFNGHGMSCA